MEMTILQAKQWLNEKWMELTKDGTDEEMMQSLRIADTVLGNYDESLKADMIAMLEELQKEVNELYINNPLSEDEEDMNRGIEKVADVIQQKIDKLKEIEDEK